MYIYNLIQKQRSPLSRSLFRHWPPDNPSHDDDLIIESQSPMFAQVLITLKSNGAWRFCVDYRTWEFTFWFLQLAHFQYQGNALLNNSSSESRKTKLETLNSFAVLDLTSGCESQAYIAEHDQNDTSFITHRVIYKRSLITDSWQTTT